jgi:hypothetical protein
VRLEVTSIEKSNDLIENRSRDLPAYSIVPQPTTLPRAPCKYVRGFTLLNSFFLLKVLLIQAPFNNHFLKFYVLLVIMGFLTLPMKARYKEMNAVDVISNLTISAYLQHVRSCISYLSVRSH